MSERKDELTSYLGEVNDDFDDEPTRKFAAWHRPRKQYVRRHQWLKEISLLATDLKLSGREFNYLSLPGNDFLDVRFIHEELCVPEDITLRYLGFNPAAKPGSVGSDALNISEFTVARLSNISQRSDIIPDRLETVAQNKSLAHTTVLSYGSFHALNVDLCDGIGNGVSNESLPNIFAALRVLLEGQSRTGNDSLLFLTTRIDSQQVADDVRATFARLLKEALGECSLFATSFDKHWATSSMPPDPGGRPYSESDSFVLGLLRWIVRECISQRMECEVPSVLTYRIKPSSVEDDIMSIAIRLKPSRELQADVTGLAVNESVVQDGNRECVVLSSLPARVFYRKSIDEKLRRDSSLRNECIQGTEALLSEVGYDIAGYRAWVKEWEDSFDQPESVGAA